MIVITIVNMIVIAIAIVNVIAVALILRKADSLLNGRKMDGHCHFHH